MLVNQRAVKLYIARVLIKYCLDLLNSTLNIFLPLFESILRAQIARIQYISPPYYLNVSTFVHKTDILLCLYVLKDHRISAPGISIIFVLIFSLNSESFSIENLIS
jgi:hypothetical protein